jgi:hypothetical protein
VLVGVVAVGAAVVAGIAAGSGSGSGSVAAPSSVDAVEVASDAPRFASLDELVAASDLVVRGEVTATERGRWFGDGEGTTRIQSRLVTLRIDEVLAGEAPAETTPAGETSAGADRAGLDLLVEEEGWLEDGAPLVIDGAAPSAVGDAGVWFLVSTGDPETGAWIVVSAQGRYLVDGDVLRGADGDDPLIAEVEGRSLDELVAELAAAS